MHTKNAVKSDPERDPNVKGVLDEGDQGLAHMVRVRSKSFNRDSVGQAERDESTQADVEPLPVSECETIALKVSVNWSGHGRVVPPRADL